MAEKKVAYQEGVHGDGSVDKMISMGPQRPGLGSLAPSDSLAQRCAAVTPSGELETETPGAYWPANLAHLASFRDPVSKTKV